MCILPHVVEFDLHILLHIKIHIKIRIKIHNIYSPLKLGLNLHIIYLNH